MKPSNHSENANGSVTMQDIADKLGISVATVSRALRRVPGINPQTRSLVLQTATDIGYRLSKSYRNTPLEKDSLKHIGIFIETKLENAPPAYLTGLIESSVNLNASPIIHYVKPGECESILDPERQPAAMRAGLLSGAILIFWWPESIVRQLSKLMPTVSIVHKYPGIDIDTVGVDNGTGMHLLVRKLYDLGHRKIGFFGHNNQLEWSNDRLGGYASALLGLGLKFSQKNVVEAAYDDLTSYTKATWGNTADKVEKLSKGGVTAWICATEPAGWFLAKELSKRGFNVPQDISITGFHRPSQPPAGQHDLTSITASYEAIGSASMKRMLHRIQNPLETPRSILFPFEFYQGTTIGPAPKTL